MSIQSINPATGEVVATYEEMDAGQAGAAVERAHRAFLDWQSTNVADRASCLRAAGGILRDRAGELARLMASEMGKPVNDGVAEAEKCAAACDYFADNAERFLAPEPVELNGTRAFVTFRPLGVVFAVMPWNFPFWQVVRFAAPTLMAGNGAVLKHSSTVPGCALAMEEMLRDAGFPEGLFATLMIGSHDVPAVIEHPHIRAVTLTGSGAAGRSVAAKAGEMLKKSVLELGGSDPYLVLEDADIEHAAAVSVKGRLVNSGQSCIAAKRFIVVDAVRQAFEEQFAEKMRAVRVGDPMSEETQVGPMARHELRDALHKQVEESVAGGARCLCGGAIPNDRGAYYPPTVLTDVAKGMPAYDEEVFGPVAAIIPVRDEDEAVAVANDTPFGLGAGVFTRDLEHGERLAVEALDAGCVFVNEAVQSNPRMPFGGVKESGYGRELASYGIKEFVNIKTVVCFDGAGTEAGSAAPMARSE